MLHPGLRLRSGRYRLLSRLRTSPTTEVWRALDVRSGVEVALKGVALEAGGADAVEHEAEAVARVRHPGAIRVDATFEEAGHGWIVMELAAGSLWDRVEALGPLVAGTARGVALAVADVLGAAHAVGVVHRDVKPQNVLLLGDGSVRLADFGIARVHARGHTRTGALLGTLPFMAPEQRRDPREVAPATDVYALGAMLAWMRTGVLPGDLFVPEVADALRGRLRAAGEGDDALHGLILACGTYLPEGRVRDGAALAQRLQEVGAREGVRVGEVAGLGAFGSEEGLTQRHRDTEEKRRDDGVAGGGASGEGFLSSNADSWGGEGHAPPSRPPLDGGLRERGRSLAEPGSAPPFGGRSLPTLAARGPFGANRGGVPRNAPPLASGSRAWGGVAAVVGVGVVSAAVAWGVVTARSTTVASSTSEGAGRTTGTGGTEGAAAGLPACADAVGEWLEDVRMGPRETTAATLADVDGDGNLDVLFTNQYDENVSIWSGRKGEMPEKARLDVPIGRSQWAVAVGDVDGDGVNDLVAALQDDAAFGIVRGLGKRKFAKPTREFQSPPPHEVALLDENGDGTLDLVFRDSDQVRLRRREGDRWAPHVPLTMGGTAKTLAFGGIARFGGLPELLLVRDGAPERRGLQGVTTSALAGLTAWVAAPTTGSALPAYAYARTGAGVLVRLAGDGSACTLGRLPAGWGAMAVGDLDGDGVLDAVASATCRMCTSNQVFLRGVGAR